MRAVTFAECAALAQALPCVVCDPEGFEEQLGLAEIDEEAEPVSDPAHVRGRGASGKDHANVIPLCRIHHSQQHGKGWSYMYEIYELDCYEVAERIAAEVLRRGGGRRPDVESPDGPVDGWPDL